MQANTGILEEHAAYLLRVKYRVSMSFETSVSRFNTPIISQSAQEFLGITAYDADRIENDLLYLLMELSPS
jgi:hypothetical protein